MALIHNERWKLTATALNGVAIATMAAGLIAPLAAVSYGLPNGPAGRYFVLTGLIWFFAAIGLHVLARFTLRAMKE